MTDTDAVATVRAFNRFYTRRLGVLTETLHDSQFTLTQVRVLYELAHRDGLTAAALARDLDLDPAYLSRLLRDFTTRGLLDRRPSEHDGRRGLLSLTDAGRATFAPLEEAARQQIAATLAPLSPADTDALVEAMGTIERLLTQRARANTVTLRAHQPGDLGWIVERHGALYAAEYGWDATFEGLVARVAADFLDGHDPTRERCWIAERDKRRVGSIAVVRHTDQVAKLRLLLVEPSARGAGVGSALVTEAVRFARAAGYASMTLWTTANLHAARRLYQAAGFTLSHSAPFTGFGARLTEQTWDLALS